LRQAIGEAHRLCREAKRAAFSTALRRAAGRTRQGEFQGVAMLRGAPLKSACLRTTPQIREPFRPKISADQPKEIRHGLGIGRGFGKRHGKTLGAQATNAGFTR
jgi:hypothetical protein